jgi:hypothetical protein
MVACHSEHQDVFRLRAVNHAIRKLFQAAPVNNLVEVDAKPAGVPQLDSALGSCVAQRAEA